MKIEDITKVEQINPEDFKTVVLFGLLEDHDEKCYFVTEQVKLPETFTDMVSKGALAYGAIAETVTERVPILFQVLEEAGEDHINASSKKMKGKPKLTVIKND